MISRTHTGSRVKPHQRNSPEHQNNFSCYQNITLLCMVPYQLLIGLFLPKKLSLDIKKGQASQFLLSEQLSTFLNSSSARQESFALASSVFDSADSSNWSFINSGA